MWKPLQTTSPSRSGFYPLRVTDPVDSHGLLMPVMGTYSEVQDNWTLTGNMSEYFKWLVESGKYTEWYDWDASEK